MHYSAMHKLEMDPMKNMVFQDVIEIQQFPESLLFFIGESKFKVGIDECNYGSRLKIATMTTVMVYS